MDSQKVTSIPDARAAAEVYQNAVEAAGFNRLVSASQGLIEGYQALSSEMLAFWQSRLKESSASAQRLLDCASVEAALEVQIDYAKAAIQAYVDQTAKLGKLASRALVRTCEPTETVPSGPTARAA